MRRELGRTHIAGSAVSRVEFSLTSSIIALCANETNLAVVYYSQHPQLMTMLEAGRATPGRRNRQIKSASIMTCRNSNTPSRVPDPSRSPSPITYPPFCPPPSVVQGTTPFSSNSFLHFQTPTINPELDRLKIADGVCRDSRWSSMMS